MQQVSFFMLQLFMTQVVPWLSLCLHSQHQSSQPWLTHHALLSVRVHTEYMRGHVCIVYEHTLLPFIFFPPFLICYSCAFNMGVITVDTALLRRRLTVLLWADIRASMSSSASSSENSCGWQCSDLIKRKLDLGSWLVSLHLAVFLFSPQRLCVGACAATASINSIGQVRTERGNLFTHLSRAKSQHHWFYS